MVTARLAVTLRTAVDVHLCVIAITDVFLACHDAFVTRAPRARVVQHGPSLASAPFNAIVETMVAATGTVSARLALAVVSAVIIHTSGRVVAGVALFLAFVNICMSRESERSEVAARHVGASKELLPWHITP